jgi:protein-tyrosine phosphatase
MSFVDIHHHLLSGLDDDGPKTGEDMRAMIHQAVSSNISTLIATPHVSPGLKHFNYELYLERLREAITYCTQNGLPLVILPGAELLYTDLTCELLKRKQVPALADTNHVLVEFLPDTAAIKVEDAVRHLAGDGFVTIVAHVEHCRTVIKAPDFMRHLKDKYGTCFQVNAESLIEIQGLYLRRFLKHAVPDGLIDFIASDAHVAEKRRNSLRECYMLISKLYGEMLAQRLLNSNAFIALLMHQEQYLN